MLQSIKFFIRVLSMYRPCLDNTDYTVLISLDWGVLKIYSVNLDWTWPVLSVCMCVFGFHSCHLTCLEDQIWLERSESCHYFTWCSRILQNWSQSTCPRAIQYKTGNQNIPSMRFSDMVTWWGKRPNLSGKALTSKFIFTIND